MNNREYNNRGHHHCCLFSLWQLWNHAYMLRFNSTLQLWSWDECWVDEHLVESKQRENYTIKRRPDCVFPNLRTISIPRHTQHQNTAELSFIFSSFLNPKNPSRISGLLADSLSVDSSNSEHLHQIQTAPSASQSLSPHLLIALIYLSTVFSVELCNRWKWDKNVFQFDSSDSADIVEW